MNYLPYIWAMNVEYKPVGDVYDYCYYFSVNIQTEPLTQSGMLYDGVSLKEFEESTPADVLKVEAEKILENSLVNYKGFISSLRKVGIDLDFTKFYALSKYIDMVIKCQSLVLLKPTIIDKVFEVKNEVVKDEDSRIGDLLRSLGAYADDVFNSFRSKCVKYEVEKRVKLHETKIISSRVLQLRFVMLMINFLKMYFRNVPRRINGLISSHEQNIIMNLMYKLNIIGSATADTYRKLIGDIPLLENFEKNIFPLTRNNTIYIKYEDWHRLGKLDWCNPNIELHPLQANEEVV